jgi:sec-independent protein translocase protein TatB
MPSFSDSIFIFVLALLLFGPKKLPELARYVGKLLGEFRRASAEFRLQMDDEFRAIEQAEQQKKIAAIEAAAPVAAVNIPEPEHPHTPAPLAPDAKAVTETQPEAQPTIQPEAQPEAPELAIPEHKIAAAAPQPLPIASSGDLHLMPPSTGLPTSRSSSLSGLFDAIPKAPEPAAAQPEPQSEVQTHG